MFTVVMGCPSLYHSQHENVSIQVCYIPNSKDYSPLNFLAAHRHLRKLLPESLQALVNFLNSRHSVRTKKTVLQRFCEATTRLLVVTEIGGMGLDIPDIELVIQFGVPKSLTNWMQRAGWAARLHSMQDRAILLVKASVLCKVGVSVVVKEEPLSDGECVVEGGKKTDLELETPEEDLQFKKKIEASLREWIETKGCRRLVANRHFDNPPGQSAPTGPCCDNCEKMHSDTPPSSSPNSPISIHTELSDDTPSTAINETGKRPMHTITQEPVRRILQHLSCAKAALQHWRAQVRRRDFLYRSFTGDVLIPDPTLTSLASNRRWKSLEEICEVLPAPWALVDRYGEEALKVLADVDHQDKELREAAKI
ncbi:hypothetical protein SERLADRAFT_409728 [Serpula lacrymans var. lacrymans S7.9]|uniref:DNA 3'-5' helicase n=1 Tax=Serpula lacrymans var. lacrymans (strain S7.9) TaxID=578457 RepID=F8P3J5_SERL9|nr:uncharacterized protein SERLADRAFT_409728 [Serpula lacrymans var. lacrymans S7.9]EGO22094.1 hypothetical protein SERLADRAFT_409728 [Serpula lacrymans var. lacrymans S7.9]